MLQLSLIVFDVVESSERWMDTVCVPRNGPRCLRQRRHLVGNGKWRPYGKLPVINVRWTVIDADVVAVTDTAATVDDSSVLLRESFRVSSQV